MLEHTVEQLHARQQAQEAMLAKLAATHAGGPSQADVEAQVKKLSAELTARTQAIRAIRAGDVGQRVGFAARLEALSRRHIEGIWLDSLTLGVGNNALNLSGATRDADLVPLYLQSLAADPALTGTRFEELVIERPAKGESRSSTKGALHFHAGNRGPQQSKSQEPS